MEASYHRKIFSSDLIHFSKHHDKRTLPKTLELKHRSAKIGTPIYRPPELWSMMGEIHTQAVDLWGVGCVIYALLVGQDPFEDNQ